MATSFEDNATSKYKHTPPPSPKRSQSRLELDKDNISSRLIDLEGTDDNVVEAVILQLQATSNRPHLVKELAPILAESLSVVQHSANPCALISARLASYLKRPCCCAFDDSDNVSIPPATILAVVCKRRPVKKGIDKSPPSTTMLNKPNVWTTVSYFWSLQTVGSGGGSKP
ncbi:hypothetical protein VDGE_30315 [Verticillium dahliae]|uniref:GDS1 winged helix domain-containing protein n=1 Tax=Verticillium dahliae TaxID=27337 RepID=A0A444RQ63_VERDA|nr:hypothetical protein VDGE_30315 [Verticillium dahliae]